MSYIRYIQYTIYNRLLRFATCCKLTYPAHSYVRDCIICWLVQRFDWKVYRYVKALKGSITGLADKSFTYENSRTRWNGVYSPIDLRLSNKPRSDREKWVFVSARATVLFAVKNGGRSEKRERKRKVAALGSHGSGWDCKSVPSGCKSIDMSSSRFALRLNENHILGTNYRFQKI